MLCRAASFSLALLLYGQPVMAKMPPVPSPKPAQPAPAKARDAKLARMPAKTLFKAARKGAALTPASHGYYTRGCLAGGQRLAPDGPAWQAMRLSRNRNWGHPLTVAMIKRLAIDAKKNDGWAGLLVGDISMPRGGPMRPSHASHQIGLDADIWLTPMPSRTLTRTERERLSATFMLTSDQLAVNPTVWTDAHAKLIKRAASFREVERVLVHPAIKKELCLKAGKDRQWLGKVRPVRGHNYHFHIRFRCPPGSAGCRPQKPPTGDDGCGAELDKWYKWLHARLKPRPKPKVTVKPRKRKARRLLTLTDLPPACRLVLKAPDQIIAPQPRRAAQSRPAAN